MVCLPEKAILMFQDLFQHYITTIYHFGIHDGIHLIGGRTYCHAHLVLLSLSPVLSIGTGCISVSCVSKSPSSNSSRREVFINVKHYILFVSTCNLA